jgi:hypothetical protein
MTPREMVGSALSTSRKGVSLEAPRQLAVGCERWAANIEERVSMATAPRLPSLALTNVLSKSFAASRRLLFGSYMLCLRQ